MQAPKPPKTTNTERIIVPEWLHKAVCISLVDLGTQKVEYKGEEKEQRKVRITRELPGVRKEFDWEEKPMVIGKKYTFSMYENATLAKNIKSWFGKAQPEDFDFNKCLSRPAQIQVMHNEYNGNTYAYVENVLPLHEEITPENETYLFSLDDYKQDVFDKLPDFMKEDIQKSPEYDAAINGDDNFYLPF